MNIFTKNLTALKKVVIYQPPENKAAFVLKERGENTQSSPELIQAYVIHQAFLRYARRIAAQLEKAIGLLRSPAPDKFARLRLQLAGLAMQSQELAKLKNVDPAKNYPLDFEVSVSLTENKAVLEHIYSAPENTDLVFREISIPGNPPRKAQLAFLEGISDKNIINLSILQPLMVLKKETGRTKQNNIIRQIISDSLPNNQATEAKTFRKIAESLNMGDTAIFIDGCNQAIIMETKGQEHRSIDRPTMEQSVRGGQSSFTEMLRVNTGLIRNQLRTSDLVTEITRLGVRSQSVIAILYLKSIINPDLVSEVKRRITNIDVDAIPDIGTLQHFIEDHPTLPLPQALSTERPDRVAAALTEGRLAILLDGSPFALILPVSFFTFFHTAEDFSFSWIAASFTRILRFFSSLLTTILPATYIAISYFHQEALPTDLVLAIGSAREKVPFPAFLEIALMEVAFELVREGGIRVPGMLGSTIGIVGAIILGQAAVAANVVSPITVVIIAITGLASFAIPDYSMAFAVRLARFGFEILAAILGLVGISGGLLLATVVLCSMKSLGVPFLAPIGPKTTGGYDIVLRGPVFSQELRPDELSPLDIRRQGSQSRKWLNDTKQNGEE